MDNFALFLLIKTKKNMKIHLYLVMSYPVGSPKAKSNMVLGDWRKRFMQRKLFYRSLNQKSNKKYKTQQNNQKIMNDNCTKSVVTNSSDELINKPVCTRNARSRLCTEKRLTFSFSMPFVRGVTDSST